MTPQATPFDYDLEKLPTKVKGIDPRVVQLILEEAREEWRRLEGRSAELHEKLSRYEEERSSVNNALIHAQKSSDDLVRQAQLKAEQILEEAQSKTFGLADEHRAALRELQNDLEQMTLTKQKFADDFRALLRGYLAELDARFPAASVRRNEPEASVLEADLEPLEEATELGERVD